MSTTEPTRSHPLLALEPTRLANWQAWLQLWQEPSLSFEQRLGLLHTGFDVPAFDSSCLNRDEEDQTCSDRICFYLQLAEGQQWSAFDFVDADLSYWERQHDPRGQQGGMRQALTHKAYAMLVQHVWRPAVSGSRDSQFIWNLILQRPILKELLWFFRVETTSSGRSYLVNVSAADRSESGSKHHWAREFAKALAGLIWNIRSYQRTDCAVPEWLSTLRPQVLDLLNVCGLLDQLLQIDIESIDQGSWQRLEEMALRERYLPNWENSGNSYRQPRSVKEAAAFGQAEAQLLLLLRNKQAQVARLNQAREAHFACRITQKKLNELK